MSDNDSALRLDAGQFEVLQSLMENESVLVTGGAGTGKTVIALALARKLADEGKRALVLCLTEPLASWLRQQIGVANPVVRAVKRYAAESLEQAGRSVTIVDSPEFWSAVAMKAAAEALPKLNAARDAVVVDEGQDLAEDDRLPVERLSEGKRLWAFWDPEQAFWRDRRVREDLSLPATACRSDTGVRKRYCCLQVVTWGKKPTRMRSGRPSSTKSLPSGRASARIWLPSRVARAHDEQAGSNVVVETFLRFKGLERPAIIVTGLSLATAKPDYGKRMYIALTRALSTVRIVDTRAALIRDPVLAPFCSQQMSCRADGYPGLCPPSSGLRA